MFIKLQSTITKYIVVLFIRIPWFHPPDPGSCPGNGILFYWRDNNSTSFNDVSKIGESPCVCLGVRVFMGVFGSFHWEMKAGMKNYKKYSEICEFQDKKTKNNKKIYLICCSMTNLAYIRLISLPRGGRIRPWNLLKSSLKYTRFVKSPVEESNPRSHR